VLLNITPLSQSILASGWLGTAIIALLSSFDPAAVKNFMKFDGAKRTKGPKDNIFLQHFELCTGA